MGNLTTALDARRRSREDADAGPVAIASVDRPIKQRLVTAPRAIAVVGALIGFAVLAYGYIQFALQSTMSVAAERLTISTVRISLFSDFIPVTGNVVPHKSVFLDAIDGGQVVATYVEDGAFVEAGQSLVLLKNTALQLEVIGREAQLAEQINNLSVTQLLFEQNRLQHERSLIDIGYRIDKIARQLNRYRSLVLSGDITRERMDDLESEFEYQAALHTTVAESQRVDEQLQSKQIDTLKVVVDGLNQNIEIARDNLQNLTVKAPISGQLTSFEAEIGESKARGQRLGKIDAVDSFKVSAFIDEFYLSRVHVGQMASADLDLAKYELHVSKIYPEVRDRQFEIDLVFASAPEAIRRGQTLRLRLELGDPTQSLTITNGPFFDDNGGLWVYLVSEDGQSAFSREVRLGRRNADDIEVIEGLAQGDRVITSSYKSFGESERLLMTLDN